MNALLLILVGAVIGVGLSVLWEFAAEFYEIYREER
jgi:hypothetical protein